MRPVPVLTAAAIVLAAVSGPLTATHAWAGGGADPRAPVVDQAKLAAVGREIASEHCARCHAIGNDDKSSHAEAPPFREVVQRYPSENLAEALAEGIVSGHPDMPVFTFEPDEIEGIIAYLDTLAPEAMPAPAPK